MKIEYFSEATLEDSFIYKTFNNSNDILEKIISGLKNGVSLDKTYIEEQYLQIKKSYISHLSRDVLDAYDNGYLEILYTPTNKIPISIPFIVRKKGNTSVATIFISSFSTLNDKGDILNIPTKTLYILMESAYVALSMQDNPIKLMRNTTLMKLCNEIYVQMVIRILNRDYALSLEKTTYNQIIFCISRFFLINLWGHKNNDVITSYALAACPSNIDNMSDMYEIIEKYDNANISDISDLLTFLKTLTPRLSALSVKYFIERYITTYNPSAVLSIDYLPYVFFVIINTLLGGFIVSQNAMSDIVKNTKGINRFYQELTKLY